MTILVDADLLPQDERARHGRLRSYFCDKDASATRTEEGWLLDLAWPSDEERHVDLKIGQHLLAWDGIGLDRMATARRRSGRVLTSLYDTWTLLTWCEWVARARPPEEARITILHLDDHRDLMPPRLGIGADGIVDLITGRSFDVHDPASVLAACDSGAVGMGSFLTPFLHAFPNCDVRQLCQPPKVTETTDWVYRRDVVMDDLLRPGHARLAVALDPAVGTGPGRYRATHDLGDWLTEIADGPVLLHVDMDYFNNRYDGDGDWVDRMRRHDPPLDAVLDHIANVIGAIRDAGLLNRIEDACVAFSPGFFPAEFWQASEARLQEGLRELYG